MKKIINCLLLLLPFSLFAQDIYTDKSSQNEYLFLGSMGEQSKKLLDVNNHTIVWLNNDQLQQVDKLSPWQFAEKIFANNLMFYADGSLPFWQATISQDKLWFFDGSSSSDKNQESAIRITINKYSIDNAFLLMFHSDDHDVYGMIRGLTGDSPCDIGISEEVSIFEVFINYQGELFKACATLDDKHQQDFFNEYIQIYATLQSENR